MVMVAGRAERCCAQHAECPLPGVQGFGAADLPVDFRRVQSVLDFAEVDVCFTAGCLAERDGE